MSSSGLYQFEAVKNVDVVLSHADSLPPEELLALLSPSQQAAFSSALSDPSQIDRLVTQELETEQPWWFEDEEADLEDEEADIAAPRTSSKPAVVDAAKLPLLALGDDQKPKTSPALVFNIVAIL